MLSTRDLYLDLLMKAVANTLYPDPDISPWNLGTVDAQARAEGRDWPSLAHTMVGLPRLQNLKCLAQSCIDDSIPGHFIETGVWRGGCCIFLKGVLVANGISDRNVYVADSFEGLPPPSMPEDAGDRHHTFPQLAVGESEVRRNFDRYGLLDDRVIFVRGWFRDTLPSLDVSPFALLRLDGDMYESTIIALRELYPRLSPGGYVIIDDYGAVPGCRRAVDDFRSDCGLSEKVHEIDWAGIWWRKS